MPRTPPPRSRRVSSDRDRDRDRERDRDRDRDRDWDRDRNRDREREREQRVRDRERERERDRDRDRDQEWERQRERERQRDKSSDARRKRPQHRHTESAARLLDNLDYSSNSPSPTKHRFSQQPRGRADERATTDTSDPFGSRSASSHPLSADSLARLNAATHGAGWRSFKPSDKEDDVAEAERRRRETEYEDEKRRQREAKRRNRSSQHRRRDQPREHDERVDDRQDRRNSRRRETSQDYRQEQRDKRRKDHSRDERRKPVHSDDEEVRRYPDVEVVRSSHKYRAQKGPEREEEDDDHWETPVRKVDQSPDQRKLRKARVVSGPLLEKGGYTKDDEKASIFTKSTKSISNGWGFLERRGPQSTVMSEGEIEFRKKRRKRICIYVAVILLILIIAIPVGITVSKHKTSGPESNAMRNSTQPNNSELGGVTRESIPAGSKGTILDPFTWYDTKDFNVTYTEAMVGGLSMMGLNSSWDDNVQANPNVPALKDSFAYGSMPVRGINVGGWLSIEPFITPSFFSGFSTRENVIDEWTLTTKLGAKAASTLEKHYSSFVTRRTFEEIRDAGFDHVRIPFSYWAVTTYPGDPYVPQISWRYLLRGIEWARQNGLRVNLDLHGAPGSQNGWNHSGRQGVIGWLNGTDGDLNAQRTLEIHNQLSAFFAQPRYRNVVTMYGLLNEPRMVAINTESVITWTKKAIDVVRRNNITAVVVFGDGFMGLDNWQGKLQGYDNVLLDVHQYVIFNTDLLVMNHRDKMNFACGGWTAQILRSQNTATGFGPTMCGEWSQADSDCAPNLNNLGMGTRWEGTLNTGNASTSVLKPTCPTKDAKCSCNYANSDPTKYTSAYKQYLLEFAQAQMISFEKGWGWFYWTWVTESAPQWSWKTGRDAGVLPKKAYERSFSCTDNLPDYAGMGLPEYY